MVVLSAQVRHAKEACTMATSFKEHLLASREDFRRLAEEHLQHTQRLEALAQKRFPSEDEQLEEVRLKKIKLRLKDQMSRMETEAQRYSASA